jgi:hypothetical protein
MKNFFLTLALISFSLATFAQIEKRRQISPRMNLSLTPSVEYLKVAGKMNLAAGLSMTATLNDKFFYGIFFTKKLQKTYNEISDLNFSYQYMGLTGGGYINLGIYKTKSGRYVKRKTMISYAANFGGGVFWTKDHNDVKISNRDYIYVLQPSVGAIRPIGKYIYIELGMRMPIALKVNEGNWTEMGLTNKDFTGPSGYLAFKFNVFR